MMDLDASSILLPGTTRLILKRRNFLLSCKSHYFINFFIERIYTFINIFGTNAQFFIESTKKKIIDGYIYNMKEIKKELIKRIKRKFTLFRL